MPQSRKRAGHAYQKPSDIPASQRTKGRILWAVLFGVFGLAISFFTAGNDVVGLLIGFAIGALIGFGIGRAMEKAAKEKV